MNKTIWKYQFPIDDHITILMPHGAKVLAVQVQDRVPCIWALVDTRETKCVPYKFRLYGTGHPCESDLSNYIGTFQMAGGKLVFHLFEEPRP